MNKQDKNQGFVRESFLIDLKNAQNETWQGNISWIGKNQTVPFRSVLEMLQLISSAIGDEEISFETSFEEESAK